MCRQRWLMDGTNVCSKERKKERKKEREKDQLCQAFADGERGNERPSYSRIEHRQRNMHRKELSDGKVNMLADIQRQRGESDIACRKREEKRKRFKRGVDEREKEKSVQT